MSELDSRRACRGAGTGVTETPWRMDPTLEPPGDLGKEAFVLHHSPQKASGPSRPSLALTAGFWVALVGFLSQPALAGVATLVTHGLYEKAEDWVTRMGQAMARHPRRQAEFGSSSPPVYLLRFDRDRNLQAELLEGTSPSLDPSGDVLLLLDWNPFSGALIPIDGLPESTTVVGPKIADALLSSTLIPELRGPVARLPLHLVGFSRGGSLVAEISKRLGQRGVVVDHLTLLDPHPLNNDGFNDVLLPPAGWFIKDGTATDGVYENVLFADAYFQTLFMPVGTVPRGAFVRSLDDWGLNEWGYLIPHHDVHLWYHGTVEVALPITSDGEETLTTGTRQRWYAPIERSGHNAGYQYSLRAGGDRSEVFEPVDGASGFPRQGLNESWGSVLGIPSGSNRAPLTDRLLEVRPNLLEFHLTGPTIQDMASSPLDFTHGAPLREAVLASDSGPLKGRLVYLLEGTDPAMLTVSVDLDANPLNGILDRIQFRIPPTGSQPRAIEVDLTALEQGLDRGRYRIGASLETRWMTRDYLAPELLRMADGGGATRKGGPPSTGIPIVGSKHGGAPADSTPDSRKRSRVHVPSLEVFIEEPAGGAPRIELSIEDLSQTRSRLEGSADLRTWTLLREMDPTSAVGTPRRVRHDVVPGEGLLYFRVRTLD